MAKDTDEFGVPYPEHQRVEWVAPKGSLLEKRIVEVRGFRTYRRNIYHDDALTQTEADLGEDAPEAVFAQLKGTADAVLKSAGEKTYLETLESLLDSTAPSDRGSRYGRGGAAGSAGRHLP